MGTVRKYYVKKLKLSEIVEGIFSERFIKIYYLLWENVVDFDRVMNASLYSNNDHVFVNMSICIRIFLL